MFALKIAFFFIEFNWNLNCDFKGGEFFKNAVYLRKSNVQFFLEKNSFSEVLINPENFLKYALLQLCFGSGKVMKKSQELYENKKEAFYPFSLGKKN